MNASKHGGGVWRNLRFLLNSVVKSAVVAYVLCVQKITDCVRLYGEKKGSCPLTNQLGVNRYDTSILGCSRTA
jgi:hypothetical protein